MQKINGYQDLSEYLSEDLQSPHKRDLKISEPIKNLEQKTLADTMEMVENFINNDFKKT